MVLDKEKKIEKYIWGLPDNIQRNVTSAEPTRLQDAIRLANSLIDQKVLANAARQVENMRRWETNQGNNHVQQPPPKRQNVASAYTTGLGKKKAYAGTFPYCNKCKLHHARPCTVKCDNCKRVGHLTTDCRTPIPATTQRALVTNQKAVVTCYKSGKQGHYQNPNVVTGTFLLNNRYTSILFDTGGDRSFVSTTFSPLIDIIPSALDTKYAVKLADRKIIGADTIIRGCTINFLNNPFNIDLMPVELGSYDVIIGMDWLTKYHVVIVCDEKLVRIPFGNEIFTIQGDKSDGNNVSRLNIISCNKNQKYIKKGCHVFLAQITEKKTEKNSKEKRIKDVHVVQDFSKVFLKDSLGLPPTRQVKFQIDLIPGAAPMARSSYRLAPLEMQEIRTNFKNWQTKDL
ncbi:putative reverse transcriptase domain-containing protein [Tanacetum coccineum]